MVFYGITALIWIAWMVLGWYLPGMIGVKDSQMWLTRILFWLIGTALAGFACYWKYSSDRKKKALALAGEQGAELEFVLAEADKKLAASGRSLATMPVFFVLGARGAAKTTLVTQSGIEPELLAGLVYQEGNQLVQTRSANVWLARGNVFVEAAPTLLENDKLWNAFAGRFAPGGFSALKSGAGPASRGVLMFVGVEEFYQQGAGQNMAAKARVLNQRLLELSKSLGARLPVYVLFTKADQMPNFPNFVSYFSTEEAGEVFGSTLPIADLQTSGVYAEQAARRFSDSFEELFRSLAERRVDLQERDANQPGRPPVYEFPREFRKLRQAASTFLVDICRPSQIAVSPFVRGFYFSGVRPVVVPDASGTQRRVPQWMFVNRFFSEVLLKDRAALGASSASTKTNSTRRFALGALGVLGLIATTLFTVSYFNNRSLASELADASRALRGVQVAPGEVPAVDNLTKLDRLRAVLERLRGYEKEGAPMMMRWGLYTGDTLLPTSRKLYFESFRNLMFGETQTAVLDYMKRLPQAPSPTDDYMTTYNALKAYLITTSNPDKSMKTFLTPVLMKYWTGVKQVDPQRNALVARQFDFYADELKESNPFSRENDATTVDRTRTFLKQFSGEERLYNAILAEANRANPTVSYNKTYPDGAKAVRADKEVQGSFSKEGFAWMQDAFKNLPKYFGGEAWVLGEEVKISVNLADLEQRLRARYNKDYSDQWKAYLKAVTVLRYATLKDATDKLKLLSGNQSPLLAAVYLASKNTDVAEKSISEQFQPTQLLVAPASAGQLIAGENQPYMSGLLQLQSSIEVISNMPASQAAQDPAAAQSLAQATNAKMVARNVAQKFRPDPVDKVDAQVAKLMEDPITYVESFLRGLGPAELNGAGAGFCKAFSDLISKYPFNPASKTQASIADFNSIFAPQTGALWTFYDSKLKSMLVNQGGEYRAVPTPQMALTPTFVSAFNRLAAVTTTAYGLNPAPSFRYSVKLNSEMQREVKLAIDGQAGEFKNASSPAKPFVWNGQGVGVRTTIVGGGTVSFDGPLGVFQWFNDAERWNQNSSTSHTVLWYQRSGTKIMTDDQGKPLSMILDLDMPIPLFRKGYLAGLQCTSNVARAGN